MVPGGSYATPTASRSNGTSVRSELGRAARGARGFRAAAEMKLLVALDGSECDNQGPGAWQPGFMLRLLR